MPGPMPQDIAELLNSSHLTMTHAWDLHIDMLDPSWKGWSVDWEIAGEYIGNALYDTVLDVWLLTYYLLAVTHWVYDIIGEPGMALDPKKILELALQGVSMHLEEVK